MKITKSTVDKMTYERSANAADYRWDETIKGFGVRVYPSGCRTFVIAYRNANRAKRFYKIGECDVLTVVEARKQAKLVLAEVLQGKDPQAQTISVQQKVPAIPSTHTAQPKRGRM